MTMAGPALSERARLEAALLARRSKRPAGIPVQPRPHYPIAFPASAAQLYQWQSHFEYPGGGGSPTILGLVRIFGLLDLATLKRAFDALTQRHESLRTVFRAGRDGDVEQVIFTPSYRLEMPVHDVLPEDAAERASALLYAPFDLTSGEPLTRLDVLRLPGQEHHLVLAQHHIVSDGGTVEIFISELAALYLAFALDVPDGLPPLQAQPADLAVWERDCLDDAARRRHGDYWANRLGGITVPIALPTDARPGPAPSAAARSTRLRVEPETMASLRELARENGATLFMVVLAAFHILFAWYTGQRDGMVKTPWTGRDRPESHQVIGCFINHLVLRADLAGDPDYLEVLRRVRDDTLRDFDHAQFPINDVIDALGLEPVAARRDLTRAMFTQETDPEIPYVATGDLRSEIVDPPVREALRDLTMRVITYAEGTDIYLRYRTDAFTPKRAADIVADYRDLLRLIARDPGFKVFGHEGRAVLPTLRVPAVAPGQLEET